MRRSCSPGRSRSRERCSTAPSSAATLGYPTANIDMANYLRPAYGIYAVRGRLADGRVLDGVANLGMRPSFDPPEELLESYFFDFDGDLYGQMHRGRADRLSPPRGEIRFDGCAQGRRWTRTPRRRARFYANPLRHPGLVPGSTMRRGEKPEAPSARPRTSGPRNKFGVTIRRWGEVPDTLAPSNVGFRLIYSGRCNRFFPSPIAIASARASVGASAARSSRRSASVTRDCRQGGASQARTCRFEGAIAVKTLIRVNRVNRKPSLRLSPSKAASPIAPHQLIPAAL